jgi:hypothetical protein
MTDQQAFTVQLPERVMARTIDDPDEEVSQWRWVPLAAGTLELKPIMRHVDEDILIKELLR